MLSEVCTPEDFDVPTPHSAGTKGRTSIQVTPLPSPFLELGEPGYPFPPTKNEQAEMEADQEEDVSQRHSAQRTSSTGTQIITANEDGLELNGQLIGLEEKSWKETVDSKGKKRERSFL